MKLYATITSERASKGQGGNDYIDIELKNAEKLTICELSLYQDNDKYILVLNGKSKNLIFHQLPKPKGEQQKGETALNGFLDKADMPQ